MLDSFVGRQPIFDRDLEVYGYELLFRGGDVDFADFEQGDRATSQLIVNAFTEVGIDRVVGRRLAFFNLTRSFVVGEYPLPVPNERVVLEVLEDIEPDEEVIRGVQALADQGYLIALDDFVYKESMDPLLEIADLVKIDMLEFTDAEMKEQFDRIQRFNVQTIAEKIETYEQFELCRRIGFDYFQGYLLSKPKVLHGRRVPANRLSLLRILSRLVDPRCDLREVREMVGQDVSLSYKMLRHINSALYGMPRRIDSISECLMYLGTDYVKNVASLLLLSGVDDKPEELVVTALLRAKMCELLAELRGEAKREKYFTAGLFSTLDALLDSPMEDIIESMPLSQEVTEALLSGNGMMGEILGCTLSYERGEWDKVACPGLSRAQIKGAFLSAVSWANQVDEELKALVVP